MVKEGGAKALDLLAQCFSLFRLRIVEAMQIEAERVRQKDQRCADVLTAAAEKIVRGEIDHD